MVAGLIAACSTSPSATPLSSPSGVAQQRTCGRLTTSLCGQVIAAVEVADPDVRESALAIADYALPPVASQPSGNAAVDYFVAFAPWTPQATQGPYLSPPMWRVTDANGRWSSTPVYVTDATVCFIALLRAASLTDYAPSFPSGICG